MPATLETAKSCDTWGKMSSKVFPFSNNDNRFIPSAHILILAAWAADNFIGKQSSLCEHKRGITKLALLLTGRELHGSHREGERSPRAISIEKWQGKYYSKCSWIVLSAFNYLPLLWLLSDPSRTKAWDASLQPVAATRLEGGGGSRSASNPVDDIHHAQIK